MTVIQLECFMEVNKQRSFSKAAATLYLSQPTLSRNIQTLEVELRAKLFIRTNNTVRLTAVGQALYPTLERLYQDFRAASAEAHEIVERHTGLFRIGVITSLQLKREHKQIIHETRAQHSNAKIQLCYVEPGELHSALMSETIDVAFSLDDILPPSELVHGLPLYEEKMCLAVPADHANAGLHFIEEDQIKAYFPELPLYLLDVERFDLSLQNGLKANVPVYESSDLTQLPGLSPNLDDVMLMVEAGLAITCITENSTLSNSRTVRMIPLIAGSHGEAQYKMATVGAYWIDKNNNPILQTFLKKIKELKNKT